MVEDFGGGLWQRTLAVDFGSGLREADGNQGRTVGGRPDGARLNSGFGLAPLPPSGFGWGPAIYPSLKTAKEPARHAVGLF